MNASTDSPALPVLYDDERHRASREVRLALMRLDLDVEIRPCPPGGARFAPELASRGASGPPHLVDANHRFASADPEAIVAHLRSKYANGEASEIALVAPTRDLELYAFETCPFCAVVRAALTELELPYVSRTLGPGSSKRDRFRARFGKTQFPFLVDARERIELFESRAIVEHLRARS